MQSPDYSKECFLSNSHGMELSFHGTPGVVASESTTTMTAKKKRGKYVEYTRSDLISAYNDYFFTEKKYNNIKKDISDSTGRALPKTTFYSIMQQDYYDVDGETTTLRKKWDEFHALSDLERIENKSTIENEITRAIDHHYKSKLMAA